METYYEPPSRLCDLQDLVQLYHLAPADHKRKRSDESDHNDQKKLATNTDNHGIVEDAQNTHYIENAQDAHHICTLTNPSILVINVQTDIYTSTKWVFGFNAMGNDVITRFAPLLQLNPQTLSATKVTNHS
ncbi:unnamed protein product [Aspergillus oryzae]|uniref:Unnamed protein product n=2 Tax=Aspergillus oryzae TaxID=5062 RepID=A0AAN4YL27_ASPOZ|nr:unnamed protein product [Aspergillus oryzae]GMF84551.1 unnamed protein product [Aspergillus oryzae]GMG12901.1 unnamed protein product [Aspergillus oryzae]GMG31540.1 unnamed protein product [Aspergillus oryzae]GMG47413.1 unnamed protein product [Aspergillus oryzae var. brunneus]